MTLPDFKNLHILVVGDSMIDRYIWGKVNRISPEAPVPVVEMTHTEDRLGGAANVMANILALGAQCTLLTIAGDDEASTIMEGLIIDSGATNQMVRLSGRKTSIKTRILSGSQHIVRLDAEDTLEISALDESLVTGVLDDILATETIDGIIIQDYNKGLLTSSVIPYIIYQANQRGIPTFVDPKQDRFWEYEDCTFFKPNQREYHQATGQMPAAETHLILNEKLRNKVSFVTLGKEGIFYSDGQKQGICPTSPRIISDVCGAGDTVISVATCCYLSAIPLDHIAQICNVAGGQVCERPGVVTIDKEKLSSELINHLVTGK
jgi:D-glycero-beta-D-manno-heptose-7-phosphate kinase